MLPCPSYDNDLATFVGKGDEDVEEYADNDQINITM